MKIKKILIQNFKVFNKVTFSFETPNLIMLDGPNGFGKTTLFDAIELLLTGQIRRYIKLGDSVIKGSQKFTENPFYNIYANGEDIMIRAEIELGSETRVVERKAFGGDLLPNSYTFESYLLYEKINFEDEDGKLISNEIEYLESFLGKNYKENFEFLNYVEQEDSIYILKNKDKDKESNIAHLFNTDQFESKIKRLSEIKDKILKLCDKPSKDKLDLKKEELESLKNKLSSEEQVEYKKLFEEQEYEWDKKELSFSVNNYSDLLGEDGTITRIKSLIEQKDVFLDYKYNQGLDMLLEQHSDLEKIIRYQYFLNKKEEFNKEKELQKSQTNFLSLLENMTIDLIKSGDLQMNYEELFPLTKPVFLENYNSDLIILKKSTEELTELSLINSQLVLSRVSLVSKFEDFHNITQSSGECVLCGYDWKEVEFLHKNIEEQTEKIKSLIDASSNNITSQIEQFKKKYLFEISQSILFHQSKFEIDIEFINNLNSQEDNFINAIKHKIETFEIDLNKFLNEVPKMDVILKTEELILELQNKKRIVDLEIIKPYFNDIYTQFFSSQKLDLNDFNLEKIKNKINYITCLHSLFQNSIFRDKEIEFLFLDKKYNAAKSKDEELKKLIDLYKSSLKKYNQKLIDDIEILFHIYSGRIVQDFQGGLGLFISNKNGLKFQTDPSKSYDAVFSMSSGQLSALIISFTLALNKKYSKNKILFIDDPVQTMDEINIVGFIELLRNDFSDHQIFMSSHEDMVSTYMRYKFKKYGLTHKRINVREKAVD